MANWPFSDITPNDIARFAAKGQWSKVAKAARLASRVAAKTPPFKVSIDLHDEMGWPEEGLVVKVDVTRLDGSFVGNTYGVVEPSLPFKITELGDDGGGFRHYYDEDKGHDKFEDFEALKKMIEGKPLPFLDKFLGVTFDSALDAAFKEYFALM